MVDILPARTILTGQVSTKLWADPFHSLPPVIKVCGGQCVAQRHGYCFPWHALPAANEVSDRGEARDRLAGLGMKLHPCGSERNRERGPVDELGPDPVLKRPNASTERRLAQMLCLSCLGEAAVFEQPQEALEPVEVHGHSVGRTTASRVRPVRRRASPGSVLSPHSSSDLAFVLPLRVVRGRRHQPLLGELALGLGDYHAREGVAGNVDRGPCHVDDKVDGEEDGDTLRG